MFSVKFIRTDAVYAYVIKKPSSYVMVLMNGDYIFKHAADNTCDVHFDPTTFAMTLKTNKLTQLNKYDFFQYNYAADLIYKSFFKKFKFKGKGFRLTSYKKKRVIEFIFGYSHIYLLFIRNVFYKRFNKYKYILFSKNEEILKRTIREVSYVKKLNFYTLRGLRDTKTIVIKRKGRKSPNL
jgi:transposase